jgi:transcriptional regulator with XRE-family HTH domain
MNQKQRTDIGKRIRIIREELNKTQIEMSKILRVQQSAISKLEKGDITPTVDILLILNRISGKAIDWILCGD